ncbi:MAG: HDOD domain-containing protein [Opitutaceae bacterium]|nr:HDOD domain-containing protein [Opitutaceae bacterium]
MSHTAITPAQFAAAAERLPSTPQIYARLNAALKDPDIGLDEIAAIVRLDASLSARVLRLSNSPMFGRGQPVDNLMDAINRTGLDEIYRLVGAAMSSQLYVTGLPIYGVGGDELCSNSLATAIAAEFLAERTGCDPHRLYTLGLLRSVGCLMLQRLAVHQICPPMAGRKPTGEQVLSWEQATFGIDHREAAVELFQIWKFPDHFGIPVSHHHQPLGAPDEALKTTALLHLSAYVAESIGCGLSIDKTVFSTDAEVVLAAGVSIDDVAACADSARTSTAAMTLMLNAA